MGVVAMAFSPDGQLLASASYDKTIRFWDTAAGAESNVYAIDDLVKWLSFSSCGTRLITERGILRPPPATSQPSRQFFAFKAWIQEDGEDLLFVHPDYQASFVFGSGGVMVFNHTSPSILELDESSKSMRDPI